jgi:hypothetical protein
MFAGAGRLDLDDLRAEVGELQRAVGHGEDLTEVKDADPIKRQAHRQIFSLFSISFRQTATRVFVSR